MSRSSAWPGPIWRRTKRSVSSSISLDCIDISLCFGRVYSLKTTRPVKPKGRNGEGAGDRFSFPEGGPRGAVARRPLPDAEPMALAWQSGTRLLPLLLERGLQPRQLTGPRRGPGLLLVVPTFIREGMARSPLVVRVHVAGLILPR